MVSTQQFFESVGKKKGLNQLKANPCSLLDFARLYLSNSENYTANSAEKEVLIVILGGRCNIRVGGETFKNIGERENVFQGAPYAVYVPCEQKFEIESLKNSWLEAALCYAPSDLKTQPYLISPKEVIKGKWGASNFSRNTHAILIESSNKPAQRLIVGETYTPSGNWSTYPPHKHEVDNLPKEVYMEEMYFFKVNPEEGFGLTKHYTQDGSIDNTYTVKNDTILMMPRGYHTVVSAPGYTTYYLWLLAGNCRKQASVNDPDFNWVFKTLPIIKNIEENLSL